MTHPKEFGRGTWVYLFFLLLSDFDDIEFNKILINNVIRNLPCNRCRYHSLIFLTKHNFSDANQYDMFNIMLKMRNMFYPDIDINKYKNMSEVQLNKNKIINLIANGTGDKIV